MAYPFERTLRSLNYESDTRLVFVALMVACAGGLIAWSLFTKVPLVKASSQARIEPHNAVHRVERAELALKSPTGAVSEMEKLERKTDGAGERTPRPRQQWPLLPEPFKISVPRYSPRVADSAGLRMMLKSFQAGRFAHQCWRGTRRSRDKWRANLPDLRSWG
jgi:hypothetical protein